LKSPFFIMIRNLIIRVVILSTAFYVSEIACFAESSIDTSDTIEFNFLLDRFLNVPKNTDNSPTIGINFGMAWLSLPKYVFSEKFGPTFSIKASYGFTRFTTEKNIDYIKYYASEFGYIEALSSHLKPPEWKESNIFSDNWRFGFGYRNGFSYMKGSSASSTLYHGGSLDWTQSTFEYFPEAADEAALLRKFDQQIRFGTSYQLGLMYNVIGPINLNAEYVHSIVFPGFDLGKWAPGAASELILQRAIDFYSYLLLKEHQKLGPVYIFILKSALSAFLYEFRTRNMFFPFSSETPLSFRHLKAGFTLVF